MTLVRKFLSSKEDKDSVLDRFVKLRLSYMAEYPNLMSPDEELVREATKYVFAKDMTVVAVFDGERLVGASITGAHDAMYPESSPFEKFFKKNNEKSSNFAFTIFILNDPEYRGQGLGKLTTTGSDEVAKNLGLKGRLNLTIIRSKE